MKHTLVKDVMIPIENYVTVQKEDSLFDVLHALEQARNTGEDHAHRDAIVVDEKGLFIGKVTMIDIFRSLEPNYKKIEKNQKGGTLSKALVLKAMQDFNLWMEPTQTLCERGRLLKVEKVMHVPEKIEYIKEEETIEKALHLYVMEIHQPLIVTKTDKVSGVVRFGDIFEAVRQKLLSCDIA